MFDDFEIDKLYQQKKNEKVNVNALMPPPYYGPLKMSLN
jgi:hypothetical protein